MIKAFLCLLFVCFVFAVDTTSPCIPTNTGFNKCASNATMLEEGEWSDITLTASQTLCYSFNGSAPDSGDVFVLSVRPGSDSDGAFDQVSANAMTSAGVPFGCAAIQNGQEKNDMDFHCYATTSVGGTSGFITFSNRNSTSGATLQAYYGYAEGTVNTCAASYVDDGSSVWFYVTISLIVVVVIAVVVLGVGGYIFYKKKKQAANYDIYEDA